MERIRGTAAAGHSELENERYVFGAFEIDISRSMLRQNGRTVKLHAKSMAVLVHLFRNRDRAVPTSELMRAVWPDVRVNPGSVRQAVCELRRVLNAPGREEIIETDWGRGYRFTAAVEQPISADLEQWISRLSEADLMTLLKLLHRAASSKGLGTDLEG